MACHFYTYLLKILICLLKIDLIDLFNFYMTLFNITSGILKHMHYIQRKLTKLLALICWDYRYLRPDPGPFLIPAFRETLLEGWRYPWIRLSAHRESTRLIFVYPERK